MKFRWQPQNPHQAPIPPWEDASLGARAPRIATAFDMPCSHPGNEATNTTTAWNASCEGSPKQFHLYTHHGKAGLGLLLAIVYLCKNYIVTSECSWIIAISCTVVIYFQQLRWQHNDTGLDSHEPWIVRIASNSARNEEWLGRPTATSLVSHSQAHHHFPTPAPTLAAFLSLMRS